MLANKIRNLSKKLSIQTVITLNFSIMMVVGMCLVGVLLYLTFDKRMVESAQLTDEQLLQQAVDNLDNYLKDTSEIGAALNRISSDNLTFSDEDMGEAMKILYEANAGKIVSMACYDPKGNLITSVPYSNMRKNIDVTEESWFSDAMSDDKSIYISAPHVQNVFDVGGYKYFWVVSMSERINLYERGTSNQVVLVVDMSYTDIGSLFAELNSDSSSSYTYLMADDGTLIYHPKANLISADLFEENINKVVNSHDGSWTEKFGGEERLVTVKTTDYTGWKIVRVTKVKSILMSAQDTKYFVIIVIIISVMTLLLLIPVVTHMVTRPISRLTDSIQVSSEDGLPQNIYVGGTKEIEYLGNTLKDFVSRLRELMKDIVREQEDKRRAELDALQSQINPHFLYNALDSLIWMIEAERLKDAIFMVRELGSLFRISLSKGKTMISIEDEIKHAKNYINIQKIRYSNSFEVTYDIEDDILDGTIVKLVLQPLIENALSYAIEAMGDDGEITIKGYRKDGDVYLQVIDNGLGMPKDVVENLLVEGNHVHKHGSGVGVMNVHKRLQIRFGDEYGLIIESEPDEGTTVTVHIPYRKYEERGKQ